MRRARAGARCHSPLSTRQHPPSRGAVKQLEQAQRAKSKSDAQWTDDDAELQRKEERREQRERKAAELATRKLEAK